MANVRRIARNVLVWSYDRGTLQYDIICALILAFIFSVPPGCFVSQKAKKQPSSIQSAQVVSPQTHSRR